MYRYDHFDQRIIDERVAHFRDQTRRYLRRPADRREFRPLRLQMVFIFRSCAYAARGDPVGQLSSRPAATLRISAVL